MSQHAWSRLITGLVQTGEPRHLTAEPHSYKKTLLSQIVHTLHSLAKLAQLALESHVLSKSSMKVKEGNT